MQPGRPPLPEPVTPAALLPLAHGELTDRDAAELADLKRMVQDRVGFHCDGYKEKCLRRRIAVRMRAQGVHSYGDYAKRLELDAAEYQKLADTLTINVSKFYRNPEVWDLLREKVVPDLFALDVPQVRIWSAGAASGEEAYTMSMVLHEHAAATGDTVDRFDIHGTDIDRESLRFAEIGEYSDFTMTDIAPEMRDRWFDGAAPWRLKPELRRIVRFGTLDLIRDPYPAGQHLIFCRNVIIYFERSVQEQLFRRFHEALVPGGYLVLGKVEALFGTAASMFQMVANRNRVFRKPG